MSKLNLMKKVRPNILLSISKLRALMPKLKLDENTTELIKYLAVSFGILMFILIVFAIFEKPIPVETKIVVPVRMPSRELRGVWMSRFDYTQSLGTTDPVVIQKFIKSKFTHIKNANCNSIFFQVRGTADAFYHSNYEPWSEMLTGTLGENPGWDPLQYAIDTAHELDLELHAWINTFTAWRGKSKPGKSTPPHPLDIHPDWLICDQDGNPMELSNHYVSFSPGNPEVHNHIKNVCMDIISNYDVDGIHFDYIRYPERTFENGYSHDPVTEERFNSPKLNPLRLNWEDWQREQVTIFLAETYNALTSIKPWIKVSAAVLGNYNQAGWNGYYKACQDVARWAEIDKIDMIIPMTYRSRKSGGFQKLIDFWKNIPNINQPIAAGLGAYTLPFSEILDEIQDCRDNGISGIVLFASSSLDSIHWDSLAATVFRYPALPPALPWKYENPAPSPDSCIITSDSLNVVFSWKEPRFLDKGNFVRNYLIYSFSDSIIDIGNAASIYSIIPGTLRQLSVEKESNIIHERVWISIIDAAGNESKLVRFH